MFMVQLEVNSIRKFVLEMKNPDKLLRGCEKFHEIEPRDIIYLVARKIILENPSSEYHILAGVEVLLLTWNAVYLQRQTEKVRRKLENDILEAYGKAHKKRNFNHAVYAKKRRLNM